MDVREIMTLDPVFCLPSDSVVRAAELMKKGNFGAVPVVESEISKKIVGIITDRDLALKVVAEGKNPETIMVENVMSKAVHFIYIDDEVEKALSLMADQQVRRVPVVDAEERLVGIIAQADVATRLDQPTRAGRVLDEISQDNGNQANSPTGTKTILTIGLLVAIGLVVLLALNMLGVVNLF